jgi:hypothetical protein
MGWVVNGTPRPIYPRERPGAHCIGSWVGPRDALDGCGKLRLHWDSIPGPFGPYRVAIPTELSQPSSSLMIPFNIILSSMSGCSKRSLSFIKILKAFLFSPRMPHPSSVYQYKSCKFSSLNFLPTRLTFSPLETDEYVPFSGRVRQIVIRFGSTTPPEHPDVRERFTETSGNLHILTRLSARGNFVEFCLLESFKTYNT